MAFGTSFGNPQHDGKKEAKEAQAAENPHSKMVTAGIGYTGVGMVVSPAYDDIEAKESNILDHGH